MSQSDQTTPPGDGWEAIRNADGEVLGWAKDGEFRPVARRCSMCGSKAVLFICNRPGCPVNGGAAYG